MRHTHGDCMGVDNGKRERKRGLVNKRGEKEKGEREQEKEKKGKRKRTIGSEY